jgi:lambda family phage minor tail protein L
VQKLTPGQLIELFTIDLTPIGEPTTYSFCSGIMDDGTIVAFGGVNYSPLPVESEGWEQTGEGKLPRPIIRLSNITGVFLSIIQQYNDLVGAILTRRRTFYRYLDGQVNANPSAQFPIDRFIIDRKTKHNKIQLEFELVSDLDIENVYLPRKQAMSLCTHRYRNYVNGAFIDHTTDPDDISCPYVEARYYNDAGGTEALPVNDNCGRRLLDCKLRYPQVGANKPALPYQGFPNIRRFTSNR